MKRGASSRNLNLKVCSTRASSLFVTGWNCHWKQVIGFFPVSFFVCLKMSISWHENLMLHWTSQRSYERLCRLQTNLHVDVEQELLCLICRKL